MHPRLLSRFVKWIFCVSTACFLIVQLHIFVRNSPGTEPGTVVRGPFPEESQGGSQNGSPASVPDVLKAFVNERGSDRPSPLASPAQRPVYVQDTEAHSPNDILARNFSLQDMQMILQQDNFAARIQNNENFSPALTFENANMLIQHVLVVQVHNRTKYLEKLIDSLGGASGIANTLLIFSHDFYSPAINRLIKGIRFCRVRFIPHFFYSTILFIFIACVTDDRYLEINWFCKSGIELYKALRAHCSP